MSAMHATAAKTHAAPRAAAAVMRRSAPPPRHAAPPLASLAAIPATVQRQCEDCEAEEGKESAIQRRLAASAAAPLPQRACAACEAEEQDETSVQPRLAVGPVGDRYEREADSIAAAVMAMPASEASAPADASPADGAVQRACSACASSDDEPRARRFAEPDESEEPQIRARRDGGTESLAASDGELTRGGSPLPAATRDFFEGRMGRDLGKVRIHQGSDAQAKNASISARAFTYRNHVWLGAGESASPSFTMAHELAHVMQQTAPGPVGPQRRVQRRFRAGLMASSAMTSVRRVAPAAAAAPAAGLTITAATLRCATGAALSAALEIGGQAVWHAISERTLDVTGMTINYCKVIASAAVGCVLGPVTAAVVEPAILAQFPKIAAARGTALGWILLKAAAGRRMLLPSFVSKTLAKLGCVDWSDVGGGGSNGGDLPLPAPPTDPSAPPAPSKPAAAKPPPPPQCDKQAGDVAGHTRVLMKVNGTQYLDGDEKHRLEDFVAAIKPTDHHVKVHGLASEDGPADFNDQLSCARAHAGRGALIALGIEARRIDGVFQHGEVEGPRQWQRCIVFELVGGNAPVPAPGGAKPDGGEAPGAAPGTGAQPATPPATPPATGGVSPKITLKSLDFTSDHGLLQDYDQDWGLGGTVPSPVWKADNPGGRAAPVSQTKGTPLTATAIIDIEPVSAAPLVVSLAGVATDSTLDMRGSAMLGGGLGQKLSLQGAPLSDEIWHYSGIDIQWISEAGGVRGAAGWSLDHELFATYATPRGPLTTKRARTAVEHTSLVGNNPHDIIGHQIASYGYYRLGSAVVGEPWQFDDIMPPKGKGADCQSIIRFIMVVNDAIGLPGEAKGLAVYADPAAPNVPKTAPLHYSGGAAGAMSDYPDYWLIDGGGNPNNYEATMEYKLEGSKFFPDVTTFQRYYPGGIPAATQGKMTLEDVLHVFTKLVRLYKVEEDGQQVLKEEEIFCYRGREQCDAVKSKERHR